MRNYDLSNLKMLIIEKCPHMRIMLRQVLREFGITKIEEASTSEAGFETFNKQKPDMVLCDWAPDFDGLDMVRRIRTHPDSEFPQAAIIMLSAFNKSSHIYEALNAGMTEYLTKPISARLLYLRIVSVIESQRRFIRVSGFVGPDRRRRQCVFGGHKRRQDDAPEFVQAAVAV